jgi:hypothetical protein
MVAQAGTSHADEVSAKSGKKLSGRETITSHVPINLPCELGAARFRPTAGDVSRAGHSSTPSGNKPSLTQDGASLAKRGRPVDTIALLDGPRGMAMGKVRLPDGQRRLREDREHGGS